MSAVEDLMLEAGTQIKNQVAALDNRPNKNSKKESKEESREESREESKEDSSVTVKSSVPQTRIVELSKCDILKNVNLDTYLLFGLDRNIIGLASLIKYSEGYREEFGLEDGQEILEKEKKDREELAADLQQVVLYVIHHLSQYKDKLNYANRDTIAALEKKKESGEEMDLVEQSILNLAFTGDFVPLEVVYDYLDSLCMCQMIAKTVQDSMDRKAMKENVSSSWLSYDDFREAVKRDQEEQIEERVKEVIKSDREDDKVEEEKKEEKKEDEKKEKKREEEKEEEEKEEEKKREEKKRKEDNPINELELNQSLGVAQYHLVRMDYLRKLLKLTLDEMVTDCTVPERQEGKGVMKALGETVDPSVNNKSDNDLEIEDHQTLYEDIDLYVDLIDDSTMERVMINKKTEKEYMEILEAVMEEIKEFTKGDQVSELKEEEGDEEDGGEEEEEESFPLLHQMVRVRDDYFSQDDVDHLLTVILPTFGCQQLDDIISEYSAKNGLKAAHVLQRPSTANTPC